MSPIAEEHIERELRLVRLAGERTATAMEGMANAVSSIRDDVNSLDRRVRPLELDFVNRTVASSQARPPRIPWRLFAVAVSSAALALAGAHLLNI